MLKSKKFTANVIKLPFNIEPNYTEEFEKQFITRKLPEGGSQKLIIGSAQVTAFSSVLKSVSNTQERTKYIATIELTDLSTNTSGSFFEAKVSYKVTLTETTTQNKIVFNTEGYGKHKNYNYSDKAGLRKVLNIAIRDAIAKFSIQLANINFKEKPNTRPIVNANP